MNGLEALKAALNISPDKNGEMIHVPFEASHAGQMDYVIKIEKVSIEDNDDACLYAEEVGLIPDANADELPDVYVYMVDSPHDSEFCVQSSEAEVIFWEYVDTFYSVYSSELDEKMGRDGWMDKQENPFTEDSLREKVIRFAQGELSINKKTAMYIFDEWKRVYPSIVSAIVASNNQ